MVLFICKGVGAIGPNEGEIDGNWGEGNEGIEAVVDVVDDDEGIVGRLEGIELVVL